MTAKMRPKWDSQWRNTPKTMVIKKDPQTGKNECKKQLPTKCDDKGWRCEKQRIARGALEEMKRGRAGDVTNCAITSMVGPSTQKESKRLGGTVRSVQGRPAPSPSASLPSFHSTLSPHVNDTIISLGVPSMHHTTFG